MLESGNPKLSFYEKIRYKLDTGDLLLWKSNTILGKLIRIWSPKYNHASLVVRLKEYEGEKNRRWILEALEGGIELRLLSERLSDYKGTVDWFPVHHAYTQEQRQRVAEWAFTEALHIKYDYFNVVKQMFCKVSASLRLLFCSEFFYIAWCKVLKSTLGRDTAPNPSECAQLEVLEKVFTTIYNSEKVL